MRSGSSSGESISGIKHPAFRDAVALTRAGGRTATGRYLVEDGNMVRQALHAIPFAPVFAVFASAGKEADGLETLCREKNVPLYVLGGGLIGKLVGTGYDTSASSVAVVAQRVVPPEELITSENALILCGEKIQDPRNVGVLIRTAEAAGCAGLLLSDDCAEPFSRQAVRSTTGSIVRLPVSLVPDLPGALQSLREKHKTVVVASSGQADHSAFEADLSVRPLVMVVGNEQAGVTDKLLRACDGCVRLPMGSNSGADSLNVTVAAGALLYEAVRQTHFGTVSRPF